MVTRPDRSPWPGGEVKLESGASPGREEKSVVAMGPHDLAREIEPQAAHPGRYT
jgi:hypothetical protein